jgi:predicted metal-dependent phosphoesterase TrpH/glycosyltransferase involved in cell wall biosynthesis
VPGPYAIAQVTPYPWEDAHEVNTYVGALSRELTARGHRVVIIAPSRSPDLVRESRRRIRAGDPFDGGAGPSVLAVGELLPTLAPRRAVPSLPVDIARTIEELLTETAFDIVHVHEPYAPSASSVALRHSRALNVGTFHLPSERVLSTQVARRFVELFFGRLDARIVSFQATADLLRRFFPADYRVLHPGAEVTERPAERAGGPVRIGFAGLEERAALRLFLRALRRLPDEPAWEAAVHVPGGAAPVSAARSSLRERLHFVDSSAEALAGADLFVAASAGQTPKPGLVLRALGAGAVPVAARLRPYEEVLDDGAAGLFFEPGDVDVLAEQLARAVADEPLRDRLRAAAAPLRDQLDWRRAAGEVEAVYEDLARRRHDTRGRPDVAERLEGRTLIDVDLHMHTDHSYDCATPVEALLATARDRGLGAIAVTDHNEVSGALDAARKCADYGVKVIVGEEVKTAEQGEVIGLFLERKIPKGLTLQETIAEIKAQGGLVYVPHPFDRLHSVPDYEHLLAVVDDIDLLEVFNPRIALPAFNEEAVRFAAKYRIVGGAGSDSHVAQGLGSVRIRMREFDGPDEFLESLREADIVGRPSSLYYVGVQALKFLQTKATPTSARRAARDRRVRRATRNL